MMKNKLLRSSLVLFCFVALSSFAVLALKPVDGSNAVTFIIKNFGIDTKGEFKGLKGAIQWNEENPAASIFNVSVNANTINTNIESRDKELKDETYFSTDKYPLISFVSNGIKPGNGNY